MVVHLVVIGCAAALGLLLVRVVRLARAARAWPVVEGVITNSAIDVDEGTHYLRIAYRYTVDSMEHVGDRVRFGGTPGIWFARNAEALRARYPEGARVAVHVDPTNPNRATLEPTVGSPVWAAGIVLALVVVVVSIELVRG